MSQQIGCAMLVAGLALATPALAQRDPWAGSWRGVLTTPQGDDTNVTITLVAGDGGWATAPTSARKRKTTGWSRERNHFLDTPAPIGGVAIAPGFTEEQRHINWWGPRLASHGYAVLVLDTNARRDPAGSKSGRPDRGGDKPQG